MSTRTTTDTCVPPRQVGGRYMPRPMQSPVIRRNRIRTFVVPQVPIDDFIRARKRGAIVTHTVVQPASPSPIAIQFSAPDTKKKPGLPRKKLTYSLVALVAIFLVAISALGFRPRYPPKVQAKAYHAAIVKVPTTAVAATQIIPGIPMQLEIPAINVKAALEQKGLTSSGALDVPAGPVDAAWFNAGPRPGEVGNAIIDGHFGYKDHRPAVFDNLNKLHPGDVINVSDDKGVTISFIVQSLRTYSLNDEPPEVFTSNDGKAHLNIITCQGVWSEALQMYNNRLVVFADKE